MTCTLPCHLNNIIRTDKVFCFNTPIFCNMHKPCGILLYKVCIVHYGSMYLIQDFIFVAANILVFFHAKDCSVIMK